METGDRRRPAFTYRRTSGDRSQRGGRCPEPHAGARTPELCPHRLTSKADWGRCVHTADLCTKLRPNKYAAGSASNGQSRPELRPTVGAGGYRPIRRPQAAAQRGYHHLGNSPGYLYNLLPCWRPPTLRPSPGSSKTTTLQSSRNWRASSPLSSAHATSAKRQMSIRPRLI